MCNPETLPDNFSSVLNDYTSNGFRVIGLAHKKLDRKMKWVDAQRIKRETLECEMVFLGFLVMQNSLKPETTQVIKELHDANMRLIMVTGMYTYYINNNLIIICIRVVIDRIQSVPPLFSPRVS